MKKRGLIFVFLLISFSVLVFGQTLVGGKLMVQLSIKERDFNFPRRITMYVQNVYSKHGGTIWAQHVAGDIYDIIKYGGAFGNDTRIGTGNLYNGEFQSIITTFLKGQAQKDGAIWEEQAAAIAKLFIEYVTIDHE